VSVAAIHDPEVRLSAAERRRRLTRGIDGDVREHGVLAVSAAGAARLPIVALDGTAAIELRDDAASWPATLRAARGAFAIVAWDGRRVMLARDHLGARPLFYAVHNAVLHAASEVSMLLRMLPTRPAPDLEALARWLASHTPAGGTALFTGVHVLPPAHALTLDATSWRLERYWTPVARTGLEDASADEAAALLRDAVRSAVRPYVAQAGVLLSGGLDSSVVLACAAAEAQAAEAPPPAAFSVAFPQRAELDETATSCAVAAHCRTPWQRVAAARGTVMPYVAAHLDRFALPLENPNGAFFGPALAAAAGDGIGALLDGEGGDELFGCEPLLLADQLRRGDVRAAWRLACSLPGTGGRIDRRSAAVIMRRWILPGLLPPAAGRVVRRLRHPRAAAGPASDGRWWRASEPRWRAHLAWLLTDWRADLGVQDRLRRAAALAGVDGAHPLLDVDLIELVLGLAPELAFDPQLDRPLLRRAMRGWLPEPVRLRPDKVFFTPLVLDALTGSDRANAEQILGAGRLELASVVDPSRARELWAAGPAAHSAGAWAWSLEAWRLLAAEIWLRGEAGRDIPKYRSFTTE
jgi:asparagine synthase (glutamine-hydrolysing)